mgnify:CR=1 FL=1
MAEVLPMNVSGQACRQSFVHNVVICLDVKPRPPSVGVFSFFVLDLLLRISASIFAAFARSPLGAAAAKSAKN